MEQLKNNEQNVEEYPILSDEQKEDIVDIIGDTFKEALDEDENAHYSEIMQASLDAAQLLSGGGVLLGAIYATSMQIWRISHIESYKKIKEIAREHGITIGEELIDQLISKIAKYLGKKYPPVEMA